MSETKLTGSDILEDLKSGRLVVVPPVSVKLMPCDCERGHNGIGLSGRECDCAPDHTTALLSLVEGMERERDEAAKAFASGAYEDACKRETGIHQHALAFTVEQFRKAEARALAAEAERDALREALAEAAESIEHWGAYASSYLQEKHDWAGDIARARQALTKDQHHEA